MSPKRLTLRYLLDRLQHPQSRAQDLALVRERFTQRGATSDEERAVAVELRQLRAQLFELLVDTRSCATCASGKPLPEGRWDGGRCCATPTERLFSEDECASLAAIGVQVSELRAPSEDHAGCVFRGARGCTLTVEQRPNVCVRHVCKLLRVELSEAGLIGQVEVLRDRIEAALDRFSEARRRRLDHEHFRRWLGPLA